MNLDGDLVAAIVPIVTAILVVLVALGVPGLILIVSLLRKRKMRTQVPGPLTIAEVHNRLRASGLSLAGKRELARMFDGQRVQWACTFREIFRTRRSMTSTALCIGEPYGGQFFFDPTGADSQRLEQTPEGARMVVEGTLRVDLDHDLLTLDAPVVRLGV